MEIALNRKRPPDWSASPTQVQECVYNCRGITALPRELVEKILANLDGKDLVVCKRVTRAWKEIVDTTPLLSRAFYRRLHPPAPVPESLSAVKDHYFSVRHWLESFSKPGRKLALELDKLAESRAGLLPERLFFALARLLAEAPALVCRQACTIKHAEWIKKVDFSPDGRDVVTASRDHTAKICQRLNGRWRETATLIHPAQVQAAYFSPTGDYCVTICWNSTMVIWERGNTGIDEQWESHITLPHCSISCAPSFSADGNYLVTFPTWHTTQIYQLIGEQWQEQTTLLDSHRVSYALFHPWDPVLATIHDHCDVYIWQLVGKQWKNKARLQHPNYLLHIYFSPEGNRLLVTDKQAIATRARDRANVYIYNGVGTAWFQEAVLPLAKTVYTIRFSPNEDRLITLSSFRDSITIWQLSDNLWQEVILPQANNFTNARFSPSGNRLVTTTEHNTVILWREVAGQWQEDTTLYLGDSRAGMVQDCVFSPHGHHLVTIPNNQDAKLWGIVNGKWQEKSFQSLGKLSEGRFSPEGLYFLARPWNNNTINIWTFHHGQP